MSDALGSIPSTVKGRKGGREEERKEGMERERKKRKGRERVRKQAVFELSSQHQSHVAPMRNAESQ
jgi:hypothetical protein